MTTAENTLSTYLETDTIKAPNILYPPLEVIHKEINTLIALRDGPSLDKTEQVIGVHGTSFMGIVTMLQLGGLRAHPNRYSRQNTIDFVPYEGSFPGVGNFGIGIVEALSYASVYAQTGALYDILDEALPYVPGFIKWQDVAHKRDPDTIERIASEIGRLWNYNSEKLALLLAFAIQRQGFLLGFGKGIFQYKLAPGEGVIVEPNELEITFEKEVLPLVNSEGIPNIVNITPCGPLEYIVLQAL